MPTPPHDPALATNPTFTALLDAEAERQARVINLIASENEPSAAVRAACGHELQNKYAEGYPGRRYYAGCAVADDVERLAIRRACELFGAEHANVQPHSGSQANHAAYHALLKPGETILSLSLDHGGHLTHGSAVNFSFRNYTIHHYRLGADERIDMDAVARLATEHRPKVIVAGSSTYSREIDWAGFRVIADSVGARLLADMAHYAGLVAGGVYPSPVPHADVVTSTTQKTLRGPRGGLILCRAEFRKAIDRAVFPGCQGGPNLAIAAAKGIAFEEAATESFAAYARQVVVNAQAMAHEFDRAGYDVVSGGTDCHMFVVKLGPDLDGNTAQEFLEANDIIVNKQMVPNDPRPPKQCSGIRIGAATITTRGADEAEARAIARRVIGHLRDCAAMEPTASRGARIPPAAAVSRASR